MSSSVQSAVTVYSGADRHRIKCYRLKHAVYSFGRGTGVRIELDDSHVSRTHCSIYYDSNANAYLLRDNNSSNRTFLNGEEMTPGTVSELTEGDRISLGDGTDLVFSLRVPADAIEPEETRTPSNNDKATVVDKREKPKKRLNG